MNLAWQESQLSFLISERSRDFILSFYCFINYLPFIFLHFICSFKSLTFIHLLIHLHLPSFINSNKDWCFILKPHSKWCHVIRRGRELRGAVPFSPSQRGSPSSPALSSSPASWKTTERSSHKLWPAASSLSPQGCPAPPRSLLAERIYLHISTFVPCLQPISTRGEAGVLGGARAPAAAVAGSRASRSHRGRAAHCYPSPGPPPVPAPLPGLCQAPKAKTKRLCGSVRGSQIYLQCREPQASRWFAGASRVPRTAFAHSTCSTP